MQSFNINSRIKRAMQFNLSTTPADCDKIIAQGSQAFICSTFLENLTRITRGDASPHILEFIVSNICRYDHCGVERFTLRMFDMVESGSVEGVEMEVDVVAKRVITRNISGIYGITTTTNTTEVYYG